MKNLKTKKAVIVLIALIVVLVAFGTYFGIRQYNASKRNSNIVNLPTIQTYLVSSANGRSHSLDAAFTVDAVKFKDKNVDESALYNKIYNIVTNLDYEKIASADGTRYLKEEIAKGISEFVAPEDLNAIYITNVVSDAQIEPDSPVQTDTAGKKNSDTFKGLFKGAE